MLYDGKELDMDEIRNLIEQQGRAFEAFKDANNARIAAIEAKGHAPADIEAKVTEINAELTRLANAIKEANRPAMPAGVDAENKAHKDAVFGMSGYMRSGNDADIKSISNTMRAGSDPDGGYLLPDATVGAIERVALNNNAMRRLCTVTAVGGGGWREPVVTSGASSGWVGETSSRDATTTPTIKEVKIDAGECYANLPAYNRLLEDSYTNIEAWLIEEAGFSFGDTEGAGFITGTGVNNQPKGIAAESTVANASYAWGKIGHTATGVSGAFATTNPADKLFDLVHTLKAKYRQNAAWLMNDATLCSIRKFQDGNGNYLWQPGLQLGVPDSLLNYPVETDDNVADIGASSLSIFFGDFKRAYRIVDRTGITILRDPYTTKGMTYFYLTKRVGGGVKNFEALKVMKFATT